MAATPHHSFRRCATSSPASATTPSSGPITSPAIRRPPAFSLGSSSGCQQGHEQRRSGDEDGGQRRRHVLLGGGNEREGQRHLHEGEDGHPLPASAQRAQQPGLPGQPEQDGRAHHHARPGHEAGRIPSSTATLMRR